MVRPDCSTTSVKNSNNEESHSEEHSIERRLPSELPSLQMRQPFKVLIDIWGVITSYKFRDELHNYIDEHLKNYLMANWNEEHIQTYVNDLRKQTSQQMQLYPNMPLILDTGEMDPSESDHQMSQPSIEPIVDSVVTNLLFRRDSVSKDGTQNLLVGWGKIFNDVWNEGYRNKTLRPHVFPDVLPSFRQWQSDPYFIKIYTYASGPLDCQRLFLSAGTEGDVSKHIISGFDAHHSYKYEQDKYRAILSSLMERDPANLFYLTDSPRKATLAQRAGITAFVVCREGNKQYSPKVLSSHRTVNSLQQFDFLEFAHDCC